MAAFGTVFMPKMALATYENNAWTQASIVASDKLELHPGAHVLHYSSTCFEGLKAFQTRRWQRQYLPHECKHRAHGTKQ